MSTSDLIYLGDQIGYRIAVSVQASDATWLDLNTPGATASVGQLDYWGGLLDLPKITIRCEEEGRIISSAGASIKMDNSPMFDLVGTTVIRGNSFGLFDAPLPLSLRGKTINSWGGTLLKVSALIYNANGVYEKTEDIATMRIAKVSRSGSVATIQCESLNKKWEKISCRTLKAGSNWLENYSLSALIWLLVIRADPSMEVDSALQTNQTDMGMLTAPLVSSWGSTPGVGTSGLPSTNRWMIRCMATDPSYPNRIWVGWEVPSGRNENSDGAIGYLDTVTGRWTIWQDYQNATNLLDGSFPIALFLTADHVYFFVYAQSSDMTQGKFFMAGLGRTSRDGTTSYAHFTANCFWPCRDTLRRGVIYTPAARYALCGYQVIGTTTKYFGEPICLPFPQAVETLDPYIEPGSTAYYERIGFQSLWNTEGTGNPPYPPPWINAPILQERSGLFCGEVYWNISTATGNYGAFRYAMTNQRTPPVWGADGTETYAYWLATTTDLSDFRYKICRRALSTGGAVEAWTFPIMAGQTTDQVWYAQIGAFNLYCGNGTADREFIIGVNVWNEIQGTSPIYSHNRMYYVDCTGTAGGTATLTELISGHFQASGKSDALTIVYIWTPKAYGGGVGATAAFFVAVIFNRGDLTGLPYSIAIWEPTDWLFLVTRSTYVGLPTSSMPFAGFVEDPSNAAGDHFKFQFVDQATGQLYTMDVNTSTWAWTLTMENGCAPIHGSEFMLSAPYGAALTSASDGYDRSLWAAAPAVEPDLLFPYVCRTGYATSSLHRVSGVFPLVMWSRKITDVIELVDVTSFEYFADIIKRLMQLIPNYYLVIDRAGKVWLKARSAASGTVTLAALDRKGAVDGVNNVFGIDGDFARETQFESLINSVKIVPYAAVMQENPEPQVNRGAGSVFGGKFLTDARTNRPMRMLVSCVRGGDILPGNTDSTKAGILFRYQHVAEQIHVFLTAAAVRTNSYVYAGGLRLEGERLFAGDIEIHAGFVVTISGTDASGNAVTTSTTLSSWAAQSAGSVRLNTGAVIGADVPIYAGFVISPTDAMASSDSLAGVSVLTAAITTTNATSISVRDSEMFREAMKIKIDAELMYVSGRGDGILIVIRGCNGTTAATHLNAAPIQAYISCDQLGRLYEIGDTGFWFGVDVGDAADAKARTLCPGDGVVIHSGGLAMKPIENAVIAEIDQASVDQVGAFEKSIDDNPFMDWVKGRLVASQTLDNFCPPRDTVSGVRLPLLPSFDLTTVGIMDDPRVVPDGSDQNFQITELSYDFARSQMILLLRSFNALLDL